MASIRDTRPKDRAELVGSSLDRTGPLTSAAPPRGLWAGTRHAFRAIWSNRELLNLLVRREIKSRYKDSSLGFAWSLIRPLAMLLIYYIAIGKFLQAERNIPDFAIYVFTGLTAWGLFSEVVGASTTSIVDNGGLVKKIYFPRELFPLSAVGSALFNFAIQFGILLVATFVLWRPPHLSALWLAPLSFLVLLLFSFALGLLLSALNVYLRDIQHLVDVVIMILFWASPVVYSYEMVHDALQGSWLEQIYLANPATVAVLGFQEGMWAGSTEVLYPDDLVLRLGIIGVVSLILIWVAQRIFARLEGNFAQEL